MTAVRIVCTHDALKLAETLARLLGAEGDDVRLTYGRQSLDALPLALEAREAVLLIWSYDAPSAHYMLEWANAIAPERLAEIARAPGWPRTKRRFAVIDFADWRGERGGRAWNALAERLRMIQRVVDPQPEPLRWPAIGVGAAGLAAASIALLVSGQHAMDTKDVALEPEKVTFALISGDGMGGPMDALEPASLDDNDDIIAVRAINMHLAPLPPLSRQPLPAVPHYEALNVRDATFLERLNALNPVRRDEN